MPFSPKQKYLIEQKSIQIFDFHQYMDDFITRPPYQRKTVWSVKKKQHLMDSLFRRYYVPKLVMREIRLDENRAILEVVDGQQRITSVQSFFENEFKLPTSLADIHPSLPSSYYKDLPSDLKRFIDKELSFSAEIIKQIDDPKNVDHQEIATEIFWRLQQGETLNTMEVAHAELSSKLRNILVKYSDDISFDYESYSPVDSNPSKHQFFRIINKDNKRMEHLKYFARFLLIERSNGYTDIGDSPIVELINEYKSDDGVGNYTLESESFVTNTLATLNLICKIFKDDPMLKDGGQIREFSTEYFIVSFYMLVRHLKTYYGLTVAEHQEIRKFFYSFYERWKQSDETDVDIMAFSSNRQQASSNLEVRDRILRQLFFTHLADRGVDFQLKDEKRNFNEAERIKIYRRDHGLCQECLNEGKNEKESLVSWKDYQADHIFPHSLGGKTEVVNGQLLCSHHNQSKSNKIKI